MDKLNLEEGIHVSNYILTNSYLSLKFFNIVFTSVLAKQKNGLMKESKTIVNEKVLAEKFNGRFAMIGFIALVGAYLTTCQIAPGFV